MDVARELLNNLMGRDRNKPKGDMSGRDHYSNRDVCKSYLICFCFNTLFPNTVYDEGPCNKRHDTYLKNMYDNDLNRKECEKEYIKQCINWIQKRLLDVQQKTKKNQSVIQTKTTFTGDRPKGVLDRIIAIDADIENMMKQAQIFGQQGQIDDSVRCLEEVDRLRQRRRQIQSINDTTNSVQKQQKICDICGAIQTINDTEKRIQTHLQGKIHQGFLKLRHEVETLKIRLQILTQMDPKQKKDKQNQKDKEKQKEKEKQRQRERQREKERERQKQREKQKQRQRQKERELQKQRERQKQRQRQKVRQNDRDKYKSKYGDQKNYDMNEEKEKRQRSHSQKKKKDKDHQRSRQKKHKKQKQDRHRSRYDEQKYGDEQKHEKKQKKKHKKQHDRSRQRDRQRYPDKRQHQRQRGDRQYDRWQ